MVFYEPAIHGAGLRALLHNDADGYFAGALIVGFTERNGPNWISPETPAIAN